MQRQAPPDDVLARQEEEEEDVDVPDVMRHWDLLRRFRGERPLQRLLQVRELICQRVARHGADFSFIDEDVSFEDAKPHGASISWPVVESVVRASTRDHEDQDIDQTMRDNGGFWSSRGSQTTDNDDYLIFKLTSPFTVVTSVSVAFYRAFFQYGEPLYPSQFVSLEVGSDPDSDDFVPISDPLPAYATDKHQTFFPSRFVSGRFLRVVLAGKRQKQLEDMMFYTCVRHVVANGVHVSTQSAFSARQRLLRDPVAKYPFVP